MPANTKTAKGNGFKRKASPVLIVLVVLAVVALIGVAGFFAAQNAPPQAKVPENFVTYPTISSAVTSSKGGEPHTLDIDLVVEYADGTQDSVSHDAVYNEIKQTVSSLDYEQLKEEDSVEYIEKTVKDNVSAYLGDTDSVENVYVGNIAIDFHNFFVENSMPSDTGSNDKLKGLFKNLK